MEHDLTRNSDMNRCNASKINNYVLYEQYITPVKPRPLSYFLHVQAVH